MSTALFDLTEPQEVNASDQALTTHEKKRLYNQKRYQEKRAEIRAQQDVYRQENAVQLREARLSNPERKAQQRQASKKYRQNNPEKARACVRASRLKHLEARQAFTRSARKAHPEYGRQAARVRRARKHQAPKNDFTHTQWVELQKACHHRCAYCGKRAKGHLTQDHITPLAQGGSHTLTNMLPVCKPCNTAKGVKSPPIPTQPYLLL